MTWMHFLSRPEVLVFTIPIVAIVVGGIVTIVRRLVVHRERMAMIEQGLHPDHPPDEITSEQPSAPDAAQFEETRAYER